MEGIHIINKQDEKILKILEIMEERMFDRKYTNKLEQLRKKRLLWKDKEQQNLNINDLFLHNEQICIKNLDFLLHKHIDLSKFDVNNDGYISRDEFEDMINQSCEENNIWALEYNIANEWSEQYIDHLIQTSLLRDNCCNSPQQELLISYGPPGSGKSSTTKKYLQKRKNIGYIDINIDNIVKDYMMNVLHSEDFFNDQEVYFKVRNGWPEYTKNKLLSICFHKKYNFRIETTGINLNTLQKIIVPALELDYHIKMLYTLVPFMELVYRLIKRESITGQGHPEFRKLLKMCKLAATHILDYKETIGEQGTVIFINNNESTSKIIKTKKKLKHCLKEYEFNDYICAKLLSL